MKDREGQVDKLLTGSIALLIGLAFMVSCEKRDGGFVIPRKIAIRQDEHGQRWFVFDFFGELPLKGNDSMFELVLHTKQGEMELCHGIRMLDIEPSAGHWKFTGEATVRSGEPGIPMDNSVLIAELEVSTGSRYPINVGKNVVIYDYEDSTGVLKRMWLQLHPN